MYFGGHVDRVVKLEIILVKGLALGMRAIETTQGAGAIETMQGAG